MAVGDHFFLSDALNLKAESFCYQVAEFSNEIQLILLGFFLEVVAPKEDLLVFGV